ncbi:POK6 protein, partial [Psilopogon haemacephalus]|nr:POK6 protein [Psilopogon haemacephalus]
LKKLLGAINWVRPYLGITNADLGPLFNLLKEDSSLTSCLLTTESWEALEKPEVAISQKKAYRCLEGHPIELFGFVTLCQACGLLRRWICTAPDPLVLL